ncbi:MAG TPA: hypothetical protein VF816_15235 [Rhodocyclaceae bacterium]
MRRKATQEYLEKARSLSYEEAEMVLSRMRGKLERRIEFKHLDPVEAVAIQLEIEDEQLQEWRERWAEIREREAKRAGKGK